ncbi:tetraacyldisaccharide 4'-kinase [Nitrincola tapanii]|uniref:Tetraacyldisaccharide 4'-kinase n=1 Tax=Nitrincola tapanii TaxID=1708751 RepID=A0A5A9W3J8_9GAMM|nr:tetraacyldisaccharide 4'-kinase [Nitrincola tapanii]KAA0875340.1 tetraacyldisaccharide 4'-kinase [Nitrincola tapanii]
MSGIESAWYQKSTWLKCLRPLSSLYQSIVVRRRRTWLAHPERRWQAPVPVVLVGNITLGGTGKTPVVLALIDFLRQQGWRPGVISRGYKAKPPHFPFRVQPDSRPEASGDEPLLIVQTTQVPLVIDPDRPAAARHLLAEAEVDILISDDGMQHYALDRDIEIAVIDGQRGLGNARCLPEGPLREPAERLKSVDFCLINGVSADPWPGSFTLQLKPSAFYHLQTGARVELAHWCQHYGRGPLLALAGIGNPERFFQTLKALGLAFQTRIFADHHPFQADDLQREKEMTLVMTAKDAIKCREFADPNVWYLAVEAELPDEFLSALNARLSSLPSLAKGKEYGS